MRKPSVSIKLRPNNYPGVINLGNRVVASLTGNMSFLTPAVSLVNLSAAVTNVVNAYSLWAPIGSRGSHSELLDLRDKSLTLYNLLKSEAAYVEATSLIAGGNDYSAVAAIMTTSGFDLANVPTPQGVLNAVVGFRKMATTNLNPNQVKFKWKRPLDASKRAVNLYRVLRGTTTNITSAVQIATTSRTSFVDTNGTGVVQTYSYWIVPVNNMGDGAASDAVTVSILS